MIQPLREAAGRLRGMQHVAQQDRISGRVARHGSDREQSLCVGKHIASANMIAAGLDGRSIDKVHRASELAFQGILEGGEAGEFETCFRTELDQQIDIAMCRVELLAA